jgi:hypothetical protein
MSSPLAGGGADAGSASGSNETGAGDSDSGAPDESGAAGQAEAGTLYVGGAPAPVGSPGMVDVTFEIDSAQNVHSISPYIYGVNDVARAAGAHAALARLGGNRLTAYNWENNASNAGSDYQFENDDYLCGNGACQPTSDTPGALLAGFVAAAAAAHAAAVVTVPIVDYVSADKNPPGDVRNSGANYLETRFRKNLPAKGAAFQYPPDASDAYVYEDEMVAWLSRQVGQTAPGAVVLFQLDNEPDLWSSTHAEVHPAPVTYAELATRDADFARAVKAAAPNARVIGPSNYGWEGYLTLQNAPDANANGDFLDFWLDRMKAAEASAGKRLVDDLDLHWYPEATGGGTRIIDDGTSPDEVAAREQAPRSLWDPSYTEASWITQASTLGPIALLPRIQQKIAQHYPGTGLSLSEWNYGGGTHISGAVATADVLGIFGVYGVDAAAMWPLNGDEAFTYAAFRAFRDYDGAGGAFGDTSIAATTSDAATATAYASLRSADPTRLVVVAVNKATSDKVAGVRVHHPHVYTKASVYVLTAAGGPNLVPSPAIDPVASNAFRTTMPAQSVTVLVLQ